MKVIALTITLLFSTAALAQTAETQLTPAQKNYNAEFTNLTTSLRMLGDQIEQAKAQANHFSQAGIAMYTNDMATLGNALQWFRDCWDGKIPGCSKEEWTGIK